MADEITASCFLHFIKGVKDRKRNNGTFQADVTGTKYIENIQTLSDTDEALDLGEITDPGWCWMRNNSSDATEFIYVRQADNAANFIEIPAGCEVMFKFAAATTAPFVVASSGDTPELEYIVVQR